jgi:ornithine carbamoyltransferase
MANSWLNAAALLGFEFRIACPAGYEPDAATLEAARAKTTVVVTRDPREAVEGAHAVNTDVWASMGQEEEAEKRIKAFKGFTVDADLMALSRDDSIFLHCLPVHRGEEVTEDVFEGPRSRVFAEAENRLHVQKALLMKLFGVEVDK